MRSKMMPMHCCGLAEIYGFGVHITAEQLKKVITGMIRRWGGQFDRTAGLEVIATIGAGQAQPQSILKDFGFRVVKTWHNGNSWNDVDLMALTITQVILEKHGIKRYDEY